MIGIQFHVTGVPMSGMVIDSNNGGKQDWKKKWKINKYKFVSLSNNV